MMQERYHGCREEACSHEVWRWCDQGKSKIWTPSEKRVPFANIRESGSMCIQKSRIERISLLCCILTRPIPKLSGRVAYSIYVFSSHTIIFDKHLLVQVECYRRLCCIESQTQNKGAANWPTIISTGSTETGRRKALRSVLWRGWQLSLALVGTASPTETLDFFSAEGSTPQRYAESKMYLASCF